MYLSSCHYPICRPLRQGHGSTWKFTAGGFQLLTCCDGFPCRVLDPLATAAEAYEELEAWDAAADMQRDLALACDGAGLTARRNAAATAWQRLQDLAQHGFQA